MAKFTNRENVDAIVSENPEPKKRQRTLTAGLDGVRVSVEPDIARRFNELAKQRKVSTGFLFEMMFEVFTELATPELRKTAFTNVSDRKKQTAWEE